VARSRNGGGLKMAFRSARLFLVFAILLFTADRSPAGEENQGNAFVYAQWKHNADWDPYPAVWEQISAYVKQATSVSPVAERRVLTSDSPDFFDSPFLVLLGRGTVNFSEKDLRCLRDFLAGGGFLLVDNSEAERGGPFARSVLPAVAKLFPGSEWEPLPPGHAVSRSFFLTRGASGRRIVEAELKGLKVQDRVAAVYCANDLHGAWARDPLGHPVYLCEPGGEPQRAEAFKLLVNVLMFSLTGTYKTDAIHQSFLEKKLSQ
jgi:hypothetical protein